MILVFGVGFVGCDCRHLTFFLWNFPFMSEPWTQLLYFCLLHLRCWLQMCGEPIVMFNPSLCLWNSSVCLTSVFSFHFDWFDLATTVLLLVLTWSVGLEHCKCYGWRFWLVGFFFHHIWCSCEIHVNSYLSWVQLLEGDDVQFSHLTSSASLVSNHLQIYRFVSHQQCVLLHMNFKDGVVDPCHACIWRCICDQFHGIKNLFCFKPG